ncbi:class I SAM-dependent methyltransferase [Paucibacter sp. R3-3]|uniref:Class I SAM-dependent methyltransferase n=1 Tax=Roseateles agri TaxID=3098619 RepID=A0ABU5DFR4_9BURK|nr:class I SAM-dependent methyltransferase [Paucibacter sp. R3-3]MDY0744570.1 class I SAM-dependent methyltransferase [Paucibacter sp. R3-3]
MPADHFSSVAAQYAQSRPSYPEALFDWLASQCARRALAWDVGAGNGQASVALAARFERVLATDLSAEQIAQARPHERIEYRAASAERSGLPDGAADLVTVAQALHWFDLPPFYAEVHRVLAPGGLFAAWTYGILSVEGEAPDAIVSDFYHRIVGPYWPAGRRHVETGYAELAFDFRPLPSPPLAIVREWTLNELLGYVRSWSATARMQQATGVDPVLALAPRLAAAWGDPGVRRTITWPISLRAGRP